MQIYVVKTGKTWKYVENMIYFSDLWTVKLNDAIFPSICSGDLTQDDIYTEYLDVEINPRNTTKIEFLWNKAIFSLLWARLGAETVNIIHGADGHR